MVKVFPYRKGAKPDKARERTRTARWTKRSSGREFSRRPRLLSSRRRNTSTLASVVACNPLTYIPIYYFSTIIGNAVTPYELNREKVISGNSQAVIFIGPLPAGEYPFFGEFYPKTAQGKVRVE